VELVRPTDEINPQIYMKLKLECVKCPQNGSVYNILVHSIILIVSALNQRLVDTRHITQNIKRPAHQRIHISYSLNYMLRNHCKNLASPLFLKCFSWQYLGKSVTRFVHNIY